MFAPLYCSMYSSDSGQHVCGHIVNKMQSGMGQPSAIIMQRPQSYGPKVHHSPFSVLVSPGTQILDTLQRVHYIDYGRDLTARDPPLSFSSLLFPLRSLHFPSRRQSASILSLEWRCLTHFYFVSSRYRSSRPAQSIFYARGRPDGNSVIRTRGCGDDWCR